MNIKGHLFTLICIAIFLPGISDAGRLTSLTGSAAHERNSGSSEAVIRSCDGHPDKSKYSCEELTVMYHELTSGKENADILNERLRVSNYEMTKFDSEKLSEECKSKAISESVNYQLISSSYDKKTEIFQMNPSGPFNDWHEAMYKKNMDSLNESIEELSQQLSFNNMCMGIETIFDYLGNLSYESEDELSKYKNKLSGVKCGGRGMSTFSCNDMEYISLTMFSLLNKASSSYDSFSSYVNEIRETQKKTRSRECFLIVKEAMNERSNLQKEIGRMGSMVSEFSRSSRPFDNRQGKRYVSKAKKIASSLDQLSNDINKKINSYRSSSSCS